MVCIIRRLLLAAALGAGALAGAARAQDTSEPPAMHDPMVGAVVVDQLELRARDGGDGAFAWEGEAFYGGDYEKVVLEARGTHGLDGAFERVETELLYSRLVGHFWDLRAGLRYDVEPDPARAYGVIGVTGLAPGSIEVDLKGFVSETGDLSARFEAEHDLLVTQRLVLQPKAEIALAAQRERALGIGKGLNDIELGLRLRYEVTRKFAPYVGVHWERKIGETARFAREDGEHVDSLSLVAGLRFWF